jgi:hypothetical protein
MFFFSKKICDRAHWGKNYWSAGHIVTEPIEAQNNIDLPSWGGWRGAQICGD